MGFSSTTSILAFLILNIHIFAMAVELWIFVEIALLLTRRFPVWAFLFVTVLTGITLNEMHKPNIIKIYCSGVVAGSIWLDFLYAYLYRRWRVKSKTFIRVVFLLIWSSVLFRFWDTFFHDLVAMLILCLLLPLAFVAPDIRASFMARIKMALR